MGCSSEVHRQESEDDQQGATEEGQGVGADEAVLDSSQGGGQAADSGGATLDDTVDTVAVEGGEPADEPRTGSDDDGVVDRVAVEVGAGGATPAVGLATIRVTTTVRIEVRVTASVVVDV